MTLFRFRFRFFKSPPCGALALALVFACALAPRARADTAASWRIPRASIASGTAGAADDNTLPAFLRGNDLNTPPPAPAPVASDIFFSGTDGANRAGAPPVFSFFPKQSGAASTTTDARNMQAVLANLAQSSATVPQPRPGAKPLADTTAADKELRDIVARQNEIFDRAGAAGDNLHPGDLESQLQQLTQRYDKLLRLHPNYVAGLVSYGQLLNIIGMKKEGAALMSAANNLDGRIPLVKNELGNYCAEEGHPLVAFAFYTAAINLAPREPLYYYQLGTLLTEARDIFLKDAPGMWTRDNIDEAMQASFRYAMDLSPGDWRYAYRYGLSYYDLGLKEWEDALQFWQAFEKKLSPGFEQQVARLHQAKILIELRRPDDAQKLLDTVTHPLLATQRAPVDAALAAYRDSVARPNPNIEIITGSADDENSIVSPSEDARMELSALNSLDRDAINTVEKLEANPGFLEMGETNARIIAHKKKLDELGYIATWDAGRRCYVLTRKEKP